MDLSRLPNRVVLRWDLGLRIGMGVALPLLLGPLVTTSGAAPTAVALAGMLVSLSSLGPDVVVPKWVAVAGIATPIAMGAGALLGASAAGGLALIFVPYTIHGAMGQAGLTSQLA